MVKSNSFGGLWTVLKVDALRSYLCAYLNVLEKWDYYSLLYIDAFAGPGSWAQQGNYSDKQLFDDSDDSEYKKGSPLIALEATSKGKVKRPFDQFHFIDENQNYIDELEKVVREKHGDKLGKVNFIPGDANDEVLRLCRDIDWESSRAVMFLDPFGMEVKWETIVVIANTKAIDLWVLFPVGVAVNRMLTKSGEIPTLWQKKLDVLFGTQDWRKHFYEPESSEQMSLLPGENVENLRKIASFTKIAGYFVKRLKTIFPGVVEEPLMLENSRGNPLFALCFAAGNKKGHRIATKIATYIIKKRS